NSYILILAIGMMLVIVTGHIDLSVGSVVAFTGAVSAIMLTSWGLPTVVVVPAALLLGALIGAWQGLWVAYVGVPAFIVTRLRLAAVPCAALPACRWWGRLLGARAGLGVPVSGVPPVLGRRPGWFFPGPAPWPDLAGSPLPPCRPPRRLLGRRSPPRPPASF